MCKGTKTEIRYKPAEDPWEGPWSDWSQEVSWETQADSMVPAYLIVLLCSIAVPVMLVYGCKICKRLKNKWDATIPSPLNSKVLADRQGPWSSPVLSGQYGEPCISKVQILECPLASRTEEKMMTEDGLYQQFAGRDFTVKGLVKALTYWPLNDQHSHTLAKQSPPFHFSGPYIMCPRSSSLPDVILASGRDSEVNRGTNLGYVSTQPQSPHQSLSLIAGSLSGIPYKINGYVDASLLTGTSRAESEELNPEKGKADSSGYIPDMDLFQGPPNGFSLKPEVQCIGDLAFQDGYILGPLPDSDLPGKAIDLSGLDVGERVPEVMGSCEANQPSSSLPNSIIQSHLIQPGGYAGEKDCLSQPDLPTMPLLMKQVGDYCFIPDPQGRDWGSSPPSGIYASNPASCTSPEKGHPKQSKPLTNPYVVLDKTFRC
ncbi:cytokine receptor common subunit beta-like [Acipenser oxyrinchus oxyrinchus]|uniref:Cytokine receptor common subunit beta-like n=1 Tax=Acipenser oxyrinchus oxyrinchus TaxID=40147 RepID=A0AAD8CEV0_ACIOX|nr:cytokine receptor common subunit beta-like [Acipenser oxyrinchus oxyrinchus]